MLHTRGNHVSFYSSYYAPITRGPFNVMYGRIPEPTPSPGYYIPPEPVVMVCVCPPSPCISSHMSKTHVMQDGWWCMWGCQGQNPPIPRRPQAILLCGVCVLTASSLHTVLHNGDELRMHVCVCQCQTHTHPKLHNTLCGGDNVCMGSIRHPVMLCGRGRGSVPH